MMPQAAAELAPTGTLRAGLYRGTPTSMLDEPGKERRGVGFELGAALAALLGVTFTPTIFAKNAEVLDALRAGSVDIIFTNASPARAAEFNFGPVYLEMELGYLVPAGARITTIGEVDAAGVRLGLTRASTTDGMLSKAIARAEIVRIATISDAIADVRAGRIDAFATNKSVLFQMQESLPGSIVLEGNYGTERHAAAVGKGKAAGVAFLQAAFADGKLRERIMQAAARAGLRGALFP